MFRITAIARDDETDPNPYTAISYLRWRDPETGHTGIITRTEAFDYLVQHPWCLYVEDPDGMRWYMMPAVTEWGIYHVRTVAEDIDADEVPVDILLTLPTFL